MATNPTAALAAIHAAQAGKAQAAQPAPVDRNGQGSGGDQGRKGPIVNGDVENPAVASTWRPSYKRGAH